MLQAIVDYNSVESEYASLCTLLGQTIQDELKGASSKVWHGAPVWFINDNPVVGYAVRKRGVQLLFWSGQSFDEPGLTSEGSFKAAEKYYTRVDDVDTDDLARWLAKAQTIQWNYKDIVKNKGKLEELINGNKQ